MRIQPSLLGMKSLHWCVSVLECGSVQNSHCILSYNMAESVGGLVQGWVQCSKDSLV